MVTPHLWIFSRVKRHPPHKKNPTAWQNQAGPRKPPLWQKKTGWVFFFQRYAHIIIFTSLVVIVNGGIHGNSPSGIVCSHIGINNATDVASSLTLVVTAIPPMAVEEAASWAALNYQVRVICANVINRIDPSFNWNQRCVYVSPAFF